jgi:hypothetical protein
MKLRSLFCFGWSRAGSNRRHMDFQSIALPTELQDLVGTLSVNCCAKIRLFVWYVQIFWQLFLININIFLYLMRKNLIIKEAIF